MTLAKIPQLVMVVTAALSAGACGALRAKVYADPVVSLDTHHQGYAVHCDDDWLACKPFAQKICGGSYKVMAQSGPLMVVRGTLPYGFF